MRLKPDHRAQVPLLTGRLAPLRMCNTAAQILSYMQPATTMFCKYSSKLSPKGPLATYCVYCALRGKKIFRHFRNLLDTEMALNW